MKHLFRVFLSQAGAVYFASLLLPGLILEGEIPTTLFKISLALVAFQMLLKPAVNLFLIPLNLLTLGMFRWVIDVAGIYLLTIVLPEFVIRPFYFEGFGYSFVQIPPLHLNFILALIAISLAISMIRNTLFWILD